MWSSLLFLPLLAAPSLAQQILQFGAGQLPQCAQNCQQLINAQTACISVPTTEHSCFCQSAYLTQQTNLFQTADGTCTDTCPQESDRQQIQKWFQGYCSNPNQPAAPAGGNNGQSPQAPASSTAASAPAATTSSFAGTPVDENTGSWYVLSCSPFPLPRNVLGSLGSNLLHRWSNHARWIAMVIVLVVAFIIIIVVGIWLKRRHDRKVNRATTTPLPVGWGPNSDPHQYAGPTEKTSTSRAHEPPPQNVSVLQEGRSRSQRLSKKMGRR